MRAEGDVEVRRVLPTDGPLLRSLRLEALADTPTGYLETLADAERLSDEDWAERAARGAEGGPAFAALALAGGRPVAMSVSFLEDGSAWLAAVYVTPSRRGRGLLDELVARCAAWAVAQGAAELRLEVHEDNARARAAYGRLGFTDTGVRAPYPLPPGGEELMLTRALRAADPVSP